MLTMPPPSGWSMIRLRNLSRDYTSDRGVVRALVDLNLDIDCGDYIALTGESGAGKSTLLKLLGCLDRATRGEYQLDGRDVSQMSDDELARVRNQRIGFVFQNSQFVDYLDIVNNVFLADIYDPDGKPDRNRAEALLSMVGLDHRLQHLPSQLSGGEQQRAAIARALYKRPALVLADEPTGNLDRHNGQRVTALLDDINAQGYTVVVVTHDPLVAACAGRRCELVGGELMRR